MNHFLKISTVIFVFAIHATLVKAQITPHEAIVQIQKGINMGNTLEPPHEGGWNNPPAEEYYFDLYKEAGFNLVRIPVRWDNYTGKSVPYKIQSAWLSRVERIVDWGLERDLFVVLNSHHDNWIKENYNEANKARFDSIWTQIAERFKNKSEKLFFEVLNEPKGLTKAQNDDMHARILSIIRKNNPTRIVIFQGHEWGGSDQLLTAAIPNDTFLMGSFHSYDPHNFTHREPDDPVINWGTAGDIAQIDAKFKKVKDWSDENNIPVFLGEFGARKRCDYNSRMRHYRTYVVLAEKYGFAHCAWDDGGDFRIMERQQRYWDEVKDILMYTTDKAPWPVVDVFQDSIVKVVWSNRINNHDSLIVQRRQGAERNYHTIAVLKPDTNQYLDVKPAMDKYYSYRILAAYNDSIQLYSQPARVFFPAWERRYRQPFNDTLQVIPGIIEAEDFDFGGESIGYHDADKVNIAGDYRPNEAVDIYDRLGEGFHIGNMITGEWLEYSVHVKTEGWYDVTFYIASLLGGGSFELAVDTVNTGPINVLAGYHPLNTVPVITKMYLYPGEFIMRFTVLEGAQYNLDKIVFDLVTANKKVGENQVDFLTYQNQHNHLIIKQQSNIIPEKINLYNVSGFLVKTINNPLSIQKISTHEFKEGIHFIQSIYKNQEITKKIILY